jgi:hypothetical protein
LLRMFQRLSIDLGISGHALPPIMARILRQTDHVAKRSARPLIGTKRERISL